MYVFQQKEVRKVIRTGPNFVVKASNEILHYEKDKKRHGRGSV